MKKRRPPCSESFQTYLAFLMWNLLFSIPSSNSKHFLLLDTNIAVHWIRRHVSELDDLDDSTPRDSQEQMLMALDYRSKSNMLEVKRCMNSTTPGAACSNVIVSPLHETECVRPTAC